MKRIKGFLSSLAYSVLFLAWSIIYKPNLAELTMVLLIALAAYFLGYTNNE